MELVDNLDGYIESVAKDRQKFVKSVLGNARAYCILTLSEKLSLDKEYVECLESLKVVTATDIFLKLKEEDKPIKKGFWTKRGYLQHEEEKIRKKRKLLDEMELTRKVCYDNKAKLIRIGLDAENNLIEKEDIKDIVAGLYLSAEMGHHLINYLKEERDIPITPSVIEFYDAICQLTVLAKRYVDNPSEYLNQLCNNIASIMQERSFYEFWVEHKDKKGDISLLRSFYTDREVDKQDIEDLVKHGCPVHSGGHYIFRRLFSLTFGAVPDRIFAIASVAGHALRAPYIDFGSIDGYIATTGPLIIK